MKLTIAFRYFVQYHQAQGNAGRTIQSYRQRLHPLFAWLEETSGITTLSAVTPEQLDQYLANLRQRHAYDVGHALHGPAGRPLSATTVNGISQAMRIFFRFCVQRNYTQTNPAIHLRQARVDPQPRIMSPADLQRLLDHAGRQATTGRVRNLALLMFMADTAARRGEVAALTLDNLRLDSLEATVNGKTGRRIVDYTTATAQTIRLWLDARGQLATPHLFTNTDRAGNGLDTPLTGNAIYLIFRRMATQAGTRGHFNPHAIRHLVGQRWADHVNLELVRQKLGHSDIQTTARFYAHQDLERVKAATKLYSLVG